MCVQDLKKNENKKISESIEKNYNNVCVANISNKREGAIYTEIYNNYNICIAVDSIHLSTFLNPFNIKKNDIDKFYIKIKKINNRYIKEYNLYIDNSVNINISYHTPTRTYTYEFSGLHQYKSLHPTLIYILKQVAYIGVFGQQCRSSTGHFINEIF